MAIQPCWAHPTVATPPHSQSMHSFISQLPPWGASPNKKSNPGGVPLGQSGNQDTVTLLCQKKAYSSILNEAQSWFMCPTSTKTRAHYLKCVTAQRLYFCAVGTKNGLNGKQSIAFTLHTDDTHQYGCPVEFGLDQGRHTPANHDIHNKKIVNFRH